MSTFEILKKDDTWFVESHFPCYGGRTLHLLTRKEENTGMLETYVFAAFRSVSETGMLSIRSDGEDFNEMIHAERYSRVTKNRAEKQHMSVLEKIDQYLIRVNDFYIVKELEKECNDRK